MENREIFTSAECLDSAQTRGYGPLSIPIPRDDAIADLIRAWMALPDSDRVAATRHLPTSRHFALLAFSERMATRAVRERKRDWIILGLLAAGIDIDAGEHDARDNFLLLPLFFDACSRSGISAAEVCGEAAKFLEPDAAKWVMRLTRHPQTLESMGYRISADTDGFRYVRDW